MNAFPFPLWSDDATPRLVAAQDERTEELVFPAPPATTPLRWRRKHVPLGATGVVHSWTIIHPGAKSGLAPYALGFVDMPGPVRIFGRLLGKERPAIGDRYTARPDETFGYVFVHEDAAS